MSAGTLPILSHPRSLELPFTLMFCRFLRRGVLFLFICEMAPVAYFHSLVSNGFGTVATVL